MLQFQAGIHLHPSFFWLEILRYITTFQNIDLTKNFYFSYTYDVTNTLQVNMTRPPIERKDSPTNKQSVPSGHNDMFVWNHYLLKSGFKDLNSRSGWILPIIYGFVDQASKFMRIEKDWFCEMHQLKPPSFRNINIWSHSCSYPDCPSIAPFCWSQVSKARCKWYGEFEQLIQIRNGKIWNSFLTLHTYASGLCSKRCWNRADCSWSDNDLFPFNA